MKYNLLKHLAATSLFIACTISLTMRATAAPAVDPLFNTEEILDESSLETKTLQDWHPVGATRQKLIEINVAEWWPGQDYRIPVRLIVPLERKAKGFSITGANPYDGLMKDAQPTAIQAKLLAGGVGIVKTHVKAFRQIPGKKGLDQKMMRMFVKDLNPRYTTLWIWSMTLMRATTAAYAESNHFEKGKVAGSGSSKNGISPAVALINDERFTATCSDVAFAYYSPTRRGDRETRAKAGAANKAFFETVKAGNIDLDPQRGKIYQRVMVGSEGGMASRAGRSRDEMQTFADRLWSSVCVAENWNRLMERGVDILFQPGTHDYVAYDILWGAQNHPQLPVYYEPNGGHYQTPHVAAAKDEQNRDGFLWHHFFGGDSLLSPPTSDHKIEKDKLRVTVRFKEGRQPTSGRIWWMYDRAPTGSAPFLHVPIPEDQWADMKRDSKTGSWTATIPLKEGASRIDFFSNHGHKANGYQQYHSSPYTRVVLSAEADSKTQRKPAAAPSTNTQAQQPSERQLTQILKRFPEEDTNKDGKLNTEEIQQFVKSRQMNRRPAAAAQPTQAGDAKLTETPAVSAQKGGGPDQETKEQFIKRVEKNTKKRGQQPDKKAIEARFQEMDANQDGIVTREERRARAKEAPKMEKATTRVEPSPSAQQPSEEQLARILKRFPDADKDKDGKLNAEEIQQFLKSRQRNTRPAAAAQPTQAGDGKLGKMTKLALVTRPVEKIEGKLPLLINLHGGGQRWWNNGFQQQLAIAAQMGMKRGFDFAELAGKGLIVLDPNTAERWVADSLDTMLDYVLGTFPEIDEDRVYVMGYSAGGGATWRWINQSADRFAAAAPCGFTGGSAQDDAKKLAKLPIWSMAGSEDGKNPSGIRKMVERLKAAGNVNVKHTEFEGADHRAGGRAVFNTVELIDWMLGFSKGK